MDRMGLNHDLSFHKEVAAASMSKCSCLLLQNHYELWQYLSSIVNVLLDYYWVMNPGEVGMFLAVGFVPTLIALEMVYRMGRAIGKRGEIPSLAQHNNKLKMLFG